MSATGRGREREKNDCYETPEWLTEAIVPVLINRIGSTASVLEPAAGSGRMVSVLRAKTDWSIDSFDITGTPSVDFLTTPPEPKYDLVITNPPYTHAMEFVERALGWRRSPRSLVAMMLRINFLGSKRRARWLRDHTPAIYVTPKRPSFKHGGNDATEYAWFLWQEPYHETSEIHILPTETV